VKRMFQLVLIDEEADLLAVFVLGQGRFAVSRQTVGVFDLRGAPAGNSQGQQDQGGKAQREFLVCTAAGIADWEWRRGL
jgi:hypothetical protein